MSNVQTFQLTPDIVQVLRNFADINTQVVFKEGQEQRACNEARNFIVDAVLAEPLPREFALYELNKLTGLIDSFTNQTGKALPTLSFGETSLTLKNGAMKATIPYSHTEAVQPPPPQIYTLSETFASFTLTADTWAKIRKIASILEHNSLHIQITTDKVVTLKTLDGEGKGTDANEFDVPGAQVFTDEASTWAVKLDALKLIPGDYTVEIGNVTSSASAGKGMFGTFFTLVDETKKVSYLTGGHLITTRE